MTSTTPEFRAKHVKRVLSEMPWLWAVTNIWGTQPINFTSVRNATDLDTELPFTYHSATCDVHFSCPKLEWQKVDRVEVKVTDTKKMPTLYDVLAQLSTKGILLCYVEHMVTVVGDTINVYRAENPHRRIFEKAFDQHPRSK